MFYSTSLIPLDALSLLLTRVTENVQVADLKIAASSHQDDFVERMHFLEAVASVWGSTSSERVKDLVLHDAGVATTPPSPALHEAASVLMLRRQLAANPSETVYTETGLAELLSASYSDAEAKVAKPLSHPSRELSVGELYVPAKAKVASSKAARSSSHSDAVTCSAQFWEWQRTSSSIENFPFVLQTAVLLDAWRQTAILEQVPGLGIQLIASFIRRQGGSERLRALNIGLALISRDRWTSPDQITRLIGLLRGIEKASLTEAKEYDRLKATHDQMSANFRGGRAGGALQKLAQFARRRPIITVRTVSKELCVSEPTARSLIGDLELPEITGRKSGRVWSLT